MIGITITQEIKAQFEERITFLKNRINDLEQERNSVKVKNNAFATHERLKSINPEWKMQMMCHKNELYFREDVLKDAVIVD
jgi:phage shock protein A